jgi:ABC-2 type transport system permease protein
MAHDLRTVVWKEFKEIFSRRGGRFKGAKLSVLIFVAVFGIFMPLQSGAEWLRSPIVMMYWAWVPFMLASSIVTDSFAGERERHTLETLLASRLPDRAILAGKIAASVLYGWGITLACVLVGAVAINIVHGHGRIIFYAAPVAAGIFLLTFLVALLASGLGVLVSLRAATVRQAMQTFSIAFLLLFVPLFLLPLLPAPVKASLLAGLSKLDFLAVAAAGAALLVVANAVVLLVADRRFRRNRMILD